jgi:hypothetical protein
MVVVVPRRARNDLNPTLLYAARREKAIGDRSQLVGPTAQDDHLEAEVVIEVHVERRAHALSEIMLNVGQLLTEIADVVVVDERERRDGRDTTPDIALAHVGAHEIAQDLRACDAPRGDKPIEVAKKRLLHGDAEANERIFHPPDDIRVEAAGVVVAPFCNSVALMGASERAPQRTPNAYEPQKLSHSALAHASHRRM